MGRLYSGFAILIFVMSLSLMGQKKKRIYPILNYTADAVGNVSGGNKQTVYLMGLLDIGFTANSDSLGYWKGTTVNLELLSTQGKGVTHSNYHDRQGISNIEAGFNPLLVWEMWVHQQLGDFGFRFGMQNVNSDFMVQTSTEGFSCGSYGVFPTLGLNYSLANYPTSGFGVAGSYKFNDHWAFIGSVYNGRVSSPDTDEYNLHWKFDFKNDGILSLSEVKYNSNPGDRSSTEFAVGCAYHSKSVGSLVASDVSYKNDYTVYAFGEQNIYKASGKEANVFLQASLAPKNRNAAYAHLSAGVIGDGFFTSSRSDNAGIGLSQLYYQVVVDQKTIRRVENTFEAYVVFQLNRYISLKPSVFAIISNPNKTITGGLVRFYVDFF